MASRCQPWPDLDRVLGEPLHPDRIGYIDTFPRRLEDMPHLVFHGPPNSGKYTLSLWTAAGFSSNSMGTEKKLAVAVDGGRRTQFVRCSDIHFEVNLDAGECIDRAQWEAVHSAVCAAALARPSKSAIVICRGVDKASAELLAVFFRYMQPVNQTACVRYFLVTENPCAIPFQVRVRCQFISVPEPSDARRSACALIDRPRRSLERTAATVLAGGIRELRDKGNIMGVRTAIYNGLTRNVDTGWWVYHLIQELSPRDEKDCLRTVREFYSSKGRGYRPVYHLERLALALATVE